MISARHPFAWVPSVTLWTGRGAGAQALLCRHRLLGGPKPLSMAVDLCIGEDAHRARLEIRSESRVRIPAPMKLLDQYVAEVPHGDPWPIFGKVITRRACTLVAQEGETSPIPTHFVHVPHRVAAFMNRGIHNTR